MSKINLATKMHKIHKHKKSKSVLCSAYAFLWRKNVLVLMLAGFWGMVVSVEAQTPYYHLDRSFSAVEFDIQGIPAEVLLSQESDKLTDIVRGQPVITNMSETYAIEKQAAIPICYDSAQAAWNAAVAYNGTSSNYPGKTFDNVGWVRGTKNTGSDWGAYLWVLQNRIAFQSSTSYWYILTNNLPVAITNVMVGSLGDYGPVSNVVDIGPVIPTNYFGANVSDVGTYQVDITNVFYEVVIPDIWITPRDMGVALGNTNPVQFTVTGTNIPNGVDWTITPDGLTSGAVIQVSNDWHYAGVMPGNVATNYKIRATSVDNTNFYDEVNLYICEVKSVDVHSSDTNTYKIANILGTHSNHFVCVKDTGDIILDATIPPAGIEDVVTWEAEGATITSPAVGTDKTTAKLSSSTPKKTPIRINIGGNTCWSGNVWVVWAAATDVIPIPVATNVYQDKTRIRGGYYLKFTAQPTSIIPATEADDVPDLSGINNSIYPPPDVPDNDDSVFNKGEDFGNGVNAKWDSSRQARQNVINPDSLPFPFEAGVPESFFTTYTNFPSDHVVGNDDVGIEGEDNNPYTDPNKGKITCSDWPSATPLQSIGSVSNTFEIHFHAREFTRLQLGNQWYRISDDQFWKIHWRFKKASEAADNQDYDGDGVKTNIVWIDNGTFIATDNNDF